MKCKIALLVGILYAFSFGGKNMLAIGDTAPLFSLKDEMGTVHNIESFRGEKFVVLIFYPGDETPVCTAQLCEIRDQYSVFSANDAVVFGVNPASDKSHKKFSEKNKFQFSLLIDEKKEVASMYMAKGRMMNQRTVYVIGKDGRILYAKRGKPPVEEILASFRQNETDSLKVNLDLK